MKTLKLAVLVFATAGFFTACGGGGSKNKASSTTSNLQQTNRNSVVVNQVSGFDINGNAVSRSSGFQGVIYDRYGNIVSPAVLTSSAATGTSRSHCVGTQCTGTSVSHVQGETPASYGESSFPAGGLILSYNVDGAGSAVAQGEMETDNQYGFGDCTLPRGVYSLSTQQPGSLQGSVHHYAGITLNASSSGVAAVLKVNNAFAMENQNGKWVHTVQLGIQSINGKACSGLSMYFYMPLAN